MNATAFFVIGTLAAAAPVQPPQAGPQPQAVRPAPDPRRQDIQMMEVALTRALQTGAQDVARQLKMAEPSSAFVTGTGRARGFILDGYGLFFDVDVPGMKQSAVWSSQMAALVREREFAVQALNGMRVDDPRRPIAVQNVRTIERLMQAAQEGKVLLPTVPAPTAPAQLAPGKIEATVSVADSTVVTPATISLPAAAIAPAPAPAPGTALQDVQVRDPNELYTESVKNALIDAMLRYSQFLKIADGEWLTVAASDSDGPMPGQLDDTSRILISIRGSDLGAFQTGKLSRDEVLKKVQVREF